MQSSYIKEHPWSIIEEGFDADRVKSSESLFSLGNGYMGQRANFVEKYTGETFQGTYIGGIYYPDKTRVGWWKNGYPEYFAKVLNAPSWTTIELTIDGEEVDLFTAKVMTFSRELNMQEGVYYRKSTMLLQNGTTLTLNTTRFLSMQRQEIGMLRVEVSCDRDVSLQVKSILDGTIVNQDTNWEAGFWEVVGHSADSNQAGLHCSTKKSNFHVYTAAEHSVSFGETRTSIDWSTEAVNGIVSNNFVKQIPAGVVLTIDKYVAVTHSMNYPIEHLRQAASSLIGEATKAGYTELYAEQKAAWATVWSMADITIDGDVKAQQGIRFNIFHLNQTYTGTDSRLNIGPKGFTGEKYGGSTYWDTEAYCLQFYLSTKNQEVAENLLKYRYNQLEKAIENAAKLGFTSGAALYPMVTMNGEECHNEWEITFEEIHRNGAIAFAIYNYTRYTGDAAYQAKYGIHVLIGIARFWAQRVNYSTLKEKYVMLGVTGPNEYENNINNNWYTNTMAKWCLEYTAMLVESYSLIGGLSSGVEVTAGEVADWKHKAEQMYFPVSDDTGLYLQQDGFEDKELKNVDTLALSERPINQHWSWDRILRSCFIKQADVLQGFYFFDDKYTRAELEAHYAYYEPMTVHESSLSPCIHSVLAARLDKMEDAYRFYLRTSRLDLDDYNKEVEEGLHITSMAGTWLSIVEGFAGMQVVGDRLCFNPKIPSGWESYAFKINFRNRILRIAVGSAGVEITRESGSSLTIAVNNTLQAV